MGLFPRRCLTCELNKAHCTFFSAVFNPSKHHIILHCKGMKEGHHYSLFTVFTVCLSQSIQFELNADLSKPNQKGKLFSSMCNVVYLTYCCLLRKNVKCALVCRCGLKYLLNENIWNMSIVSHAMLMVLLIFCGRHMTIKCCLWRQCPIITTFTCFRGACLKALNPLNPTFKCFCS